jgi:hypothetical protein
VNLARIADVEQRKSNEMIGAELGYRYIDSPVIASEPGDGPEHNFMKYVPTTWPGARLPHVWLKDRTALHDRIGDGYTLLRLGRKRPDTTPLEQAFASHAAPFTVLEINEKRPRDIYGFDLLLLRPDLHVVWRGNRMPDDSGKLAALATGH